MIKYPLKNHLEIILKYKDKENWIENTISITMRTPGMMRI
jgi:hypothetical protein